MTTFSKLAIALAAALLTACATVNQGSVRSSGEGVDSSAAWATLDLDNDGWRDAIHTIKGTARGIGAGLLAEACERVETTGPGALPTVHAALDATLGDIAAYQHEVMIQSLRTSPRL